MSGDDLDATFVLAPTKEQGFFAERHKCNLVVYYDQSTSDNKFLSGSTNDEHLIALRSLHMAIYDYSYQIQLQNPPRLLVGGLDAWVNLVGKQALKVTDLDEIAPSRPSGTASREARSLERPGNRVSTGGETSPDARTAMLREALYHHR
jgi:ubiquitin carboxyl-terminal hydrolase 8